MRQRAALGNKSDESTRGEEIVDAGQGADRIEKSYHNMPSLREMSFGLERIERTDGDARYPHALAIFATVQRLRTEGHEYTAIIAEHKAGVKAVAEFLAREDALQGLLDLMKIQPGEAFPGSFQVVFRIIVERPRFDTAEILPAEPQSFVVDQRQ